MKDELVSVLVLSFNAESTIEETLNSIKNQSYNNLELIISDDSSTDNTIGVCKKWILENCSRFENVTLLTSDTNQGVCANGNKAGKVASGEWLKGIAADDILFPNCISDFITYSRLHPEASFISSLMSVYDEFFDDNRCLIKEKGPKNRDIFQQPVEKQLRQMAYDSYIYAPTVFIKRTVFIEVGGYNEKYIFEDWPLYMDVLEKGYKLFFLDKVTVGYRFHKSSSNTTGKLFNYIFIKKTQSFIRDRCFKYYSKRRIFATKAKWLVEKTMYKLGLDKKKCLNQLIYDCATWTLARIGGK